LELKVKLYGKTHPETVVTLALLVQLFAREMKYESIRELSGWFSEEPKLVYSNYYPESQLALRTLKRFSFQVPDYCPSSNSSSSSSDDEEDGEVVKGSDDEKEGEVVEGSDEEKRNDNH
jgi:hypothetical protein